MPHLLQLRVPRFLVRFFHESSALIGSISIGIGWVAIPVLTTVLATQTPELTLIERYGVFGLFSVVVLYLLTVARQTMVKIGDNIREHTKAAQSSADAINQLVTHNREWQREQTEERDRAVQRLIDEVNIAVVKARDDGERRAREEAERRGKR